MLQLPEVDVSRIGGDVAINYLNTVDWRLDPGRTRQRLVDYGQLVAWAHAFELIDDDEAALILATAGDHPSAAEVEFLAMLRLRDDAYDALMEGTSPIMLQERLLAAQGRSRLEIGEDRRWRWQQTGIDLRTPGDRVALAFGTLLASPDIALLHRCEDQRCGWMFLDRSRRRNRRWCSSEDCGNRNRVRSHYQRTKAER